MKKRKILFDGRTTYLSNPTEANKLALCALAKEHNVEVFSDRTPTYTTIYYSGSGENIQGSGYSSHNSVDFETFAAEIIKPSKPTEIKVQLNPVHSAIVSKKEIVVGCQTFPIEILDKLNDARTKLNQE